MTVSMKEKFGLYLILTDPVAGYVQCAEAAVACGVRYLQLRMKNQPRAAVMKTARILREITRGTGTRFIVNDDLTVAMESDADGLHLGQNDLDIEEARQKWKTAGKIFGLSTHNLAQERSARKLDPDYIGVGPVFSTRTKSDADPVLGPKEAGKIIRQSPLLSVAIGGINASNLSEILHAGAVNFCVAGAVNQSSDPQTTIKELIEVWHDTCF